ncbi:MAG: hypothetical protein ACREBO_09420 [Novosphingobium sp.]
MFEKTRSDIVDRLGKLLDRYELIAARARDWREKSQFGARLGLPALESTPVFCEIEGKANEQAGLCGESITLLLRDRALPLLFKNRVGKAENFAAQCEAILDDLDAGEQGGKAAFRSRFGSMDS